MSGLAIRERLLRLRHLLRRFGHFDGSRRLLLVEASALLLLSRLLLSVVPFKRLTPRLGRMAQPGEMPDAPAQTHADQERSAAEIAVDIGWAVQCAARHLPFDAVCLPQAMAAQSMLRRRHVASVMHFGVAKGAEKPFEAHAWLDAAGAEVVGYPTIGFTEIARFV